MASGKLTAPDLTGFTGTYGIHSNAWDSLERGRRRAMGVLLRGGQVMDPGAGLTGALDVRVRDGLVTEVRAGLAPDGDTGTDGTGRLGLPGRIDLHAHCFAAASALGRRTDDVARATGETAWADGRTTCRGTHAGT